MCKEEYDWKRDKRDDLFEEVFALSHLPDSFITTGYCPEYDVLDMLTGEFYEVKRDYRWVETDNILVEEFYNLEAGKEGWIYHTEADFYVIFVTDYLYCIVNMYHVKNDFFNRISKWWLADITQNNDGRFTTRNWVTPLKNFEHEFYLAIPNADMIAKYNLEKVVK